MINDVYAAINFKAFTTKIHDVARDQFLFIVTEDECNKKRYPLLTKVMKIPWRIKLIPSHKKSIALRVQCFK